MPSDVVPDPGAPVIMRFMDLRGKLSAKKSALATRRQMV
jgi:hypothetical protein